METLRRITRIIDSISDWVGRIGSWSVIVLMLLVVFEVISRRLFNSPTIWTFETITMIFGFHFMIVAAYALLHKSIVSVDLLYQRLSPKKQAILDLITYAVFFFPFVLGLFYIGIVYAATSWASREVSSSLFAPPLYPIKTVIPVVFALLALQGISEVLKRIITLVTGEKAHD